LPLDPLPDDTGALLANGPLDDALVAGFLIGYRGRTRAAYLADLCDFHAWCAGPRLGCWLCVAPMLRPTRQLSE
jgi:hypothetical protein